MKLRLLGTAMMLISLASSLVGAATLTVTTPNPSIAADGQCSLIEAVINANDDVQTHADCLAGSGADTIVLSGITYTLTESYDGINGLPVVTSPITIQGNDATIARDTSSAEAFRLFEVDGFRHEGNLTIYHTTVTGGYVYGGGGGILGGPLTLNNATVTGNTTIDGLGGGVDAAWGAIIDSTISDNSGGGGITGAETIINSTISGNRSDSPGAGVVGARIIISSTISGNVSTSGDAGGIKTNYLTLINSTVVDNEGGGVLVAIDDFTDGNLILINSIIANNNGYDCVADGVGVSIGSLIGDGSCQSALFPPGGDPIVGDPMLGPLQDNGGPTETHALLAGSPAIDGGSEVCLDADGEPLTTDQRGQPRPVDGNGDGFTACDMGAFEIQKAALDLPPIVIPPIPNIDFTGSGGGGGSGCFIATAAFGSPMAKEVDLLRGFRDERLMTNAVGRWIVAVYYEYSPPVADIIAQHELLRKATRVVLAPLVFIIKYPGVSLSTDLMILVVLFVLARRRTVAHS